MQRWLDAFAACGLDPAFYANRRRPFDEVLPWDHLDFGVTKDFLIRENRPGMGEHHHPPTAVRPAPPAVPPVSKEGSALNDVKEFRTIRLVFSKTGRARYMSHLDLNRAMIRALRRAKLPVWYTEGFNRHPYVTFAAPLSLGYEGLHETMDLRLEEDVPMEELVSVWARCCPKACGRSRPPPRCGSRGRWRPPGMSSSSAARACAVRALLERDSLPSKNGPRRKP